MGIIHLGALSNCFEGIALFYRVNKVSRDPLAQMVLQALWYVQTIKFFLFLMEVNAFYITSFSLLFSPVSQRAHRVCLVLKETLVLKERR